MTNNAINEAFTNEVAQSFIQALQENTAPWTQGWEAGEAPNLPKNAKTNVAYNGMNSLKLSMKALRAGYKDPRWLTFNQAKELGATINKGATSEQIIVFKEHGFKVMTEEDGTNQVVRFNFRQPMIKIYRVFNAEQTTGLEAYIAPKPKMPSFNDIENIEKLMADTNIAIEHIASKGAYYMPHSDKIILPEKSQFHSQYEYYATALHEIGHATGHESRLNRPFLHSVKGSVAYAKEELRAEISSFMVGVKTGLGHYPENHQAYIKSWIKILQDKPKEIFEAVRDADKITKWVIQPELRPELELKAKPVVRNTEAIREPLAVASLEARNQEPLFNVINMPKPDLTPKIVMIADILEKPLSVRM